MKLIKQTTPAWLLATALGLGAAAPQARADDANIDQVQETSAKSDKLRKLQIVNRAFQVCFGRGMKRAEVGQYLKMTKFQIIKAMLSSSELSELYGQRLATFADGADGANVKASQVPSEVRQIARPTDKLEEVLTKLAKDRHKGTQCGDEKNSVCFARWLVARTAPGLGYEWVKANEAEIPTWSYARLLEQITTASL